MSKTALVFGSGGARGISHLGVLKALEELGLKADIVVGTSIGSIVAAAYAAGTVDDLREKVLSMNWIQLASLFMNPSFRRSGLVGGAKIQDFLRDWIPAIDIGRLATPYAAVASDLNTQTDVVLTSGTLLDAVRASISIPGVFVPVLRGGRCLVDGGLTNPLPVSVARDLGAEKVVAVDINLGRPSDGPPPNGLAGRIARKIGFSTSKPKSGKTPNIVQILVESLRIGENAIQRERYNREPADLLLSPAVGDTGTLDFTTPEPVFLAGYDAAMASAPALRGLLSKS